MRVWGALLGFLAALALGVAFTLHGPAPTGLDSDAKPPEGPDAVASFLDDSVAWRSWTEDEAVRRLVDAPLKWRGLEDFDSEARIAVRRHMVRAEERIRAAVRAFHAGRLDARESRRELEEAFREYSDALEAQSRTR